MAGLESDGFRSAALGELIVDFRGGAKRVRKVARQVAEIQYLKRAGKA